MTEDNFDGYLEKAIQSVLNDVKIDLGNNKDLIRSGLKRHVRLLIHAKLDDLIKKLVP